MKIYFFHGLESGPFGSKYQSLSAEFEVHSPDFQHLDLVERLALAEEVTRDDTDAILVGSSFGGLVGALLYDRHPERFRTYILLAPALHTERSESVKAVPPNGVIIHGTHDEIVPIGPVQTFAQKFGLQFIEVDDEHRLSESHEHMIQAVRGAR